MDKPSSNEEIQLVAILRILKKNQDEVAEILKIRKEKVGNIEQWLRAESLDLVEGLFVDYRLKKVIDDKLGDYELLPRELIEAARLKPDDILEYYRKDYSQKPSGSQNSIKTKQAVSKESRTKQGTYEETRHKQKIQRQPDSAVDQLGKEHWNDLVVLCREIIKRMSLPIEFTESYLGKPLNVSKDVDVIGALMLVNERPKDLIDFLKEGEAITNRDLYPNLLIHLQAEDGEWKTKVSKFWDTAVILHNKFYTMAQKVAEMAKQTKNFPQSWQVWIDDESGLRVYAGTEASASVENALKPMGIDTLKAQREFRDAMGKIQETLKLVSMRRTFKGRCPACPKYG